MPEDWKAGEWHLLALTFAVSKDWPLAAPFIEANVEKVADESVRASKGQLMSTVDARFWRKGGDSRTRVRVGGIRMMRPKTTRQMAGLKPKDGDL